jgi:hypothetical protein
MLIDLSVASQRYVEDCEVCCRPIEVSCSVAENGVQDFDAQPSDRS